MKCNSNLLNINKFANIFINKISLNEEAEKSNQGHQKVMFCFFVQIHTALSLPKAPVKHNNNPMNKFFILNLLKQSGVKF